MTEFRLSFDIDLPSGAAVDRVVLPRLGEAFAALVGAARERWQEYASGKPLPDGKVINPRSGSYARSIAVRWHGPFHAEIYSDIPYAEAIESGSPARDLHDLLSTSKKTRINSRGQRYLIIPFRWGTPGTANNPRVGFGDNVMPESVHQGWLGGEFGDPSRIVGHSHRISGSGHQVRKRIYSWGGRVAQSDLDARGIGREFRGKTYLTHPMAGMVRMTRGKKGAQNTQYLTFRTLSEGSPGWIVPPVEGRWPARTVAELMRPVAEEALKTAARDDVRRYLGA
jgi:hypothetical protein